MGEFMPGKRRERFRTVVMPEGYSYSGKTVGLTKNTVRVHFKKIEEEELS